MLLLVLLGSSARPLPTHKEAASDPDCLPRGIHLGVADDPQTSISVSWYTRKALDGPCDVEIGVQGDTLTWRATGTSVTHPSLGQSHYHEVVVGGLEPGVAYEILPRHGSREEHALISRTFNSPGDNLMMTAYADQETSEVSANMVRSAAAVAADLHLHAGDLCHANGDPDIWDAWFDMIEPLARQRPYLTVFGNHDGDETGEANGYLNRLSMPGNELYYSIRHDHLVLIVLDSEHLERQAALLQRDWARAELEAAANDPRISWIVVSIHRPLYSSSNHGGELVLIAHLEPLLVQYGVDLVITGHDHVYERSFPVANGVVQSFDQQSYCDIGAPIHVVSGGGGAHLYQNGWSYFTAAAAAEHHFLRLHFQGKQRLQVDAIMPDGTLIDRFEIIKSGAMPKRSANRN